MIEAATATGLAWYWWALICYATGIAVVVFVAGYLDCEEADAFVPLAMFWPVLALVACAAAPFAALWFLGNMLRRRA